MVLAAAAGALPVGSLEGDTGRYLAIFLGLVSASILPTISLILGSMSSNSRSVKAVNELAAELRAAIDALLFLFGLVAVTIVGLVALTIPMLPVLAKIPHVSEVLDRSGQALVGASTAAIVMRSGQIPGILRRSLDIRHQIATAEARRRILENAPAPGRVRETFPTHPDFGKPVDISERHTDQDPH